MRFANQFTGGSYSAYNATGETLDFGVLRHYDASARRHQLSGIGGYELSLSMRGNYNHKKPAGIMCPRFELVDLEVE